MRLLLDTHTLIWMCWDGKRFPRPAADAILSADNALFCSVVSWWEIAVKVGIGKLVLADEWSASMKRELRRNNVGWLTLSTGHCEQVQSLPFHHKDPFDRMLIAQAQSEGLSILTADRQFCRYDIPVIW
jgi:PIN domain nuclease of toxin-antitoxin system